MLLCAREMWMVVEGRKVGEKAMCGGEKWGHTMSLWDGHKLNCGMRTKGDRRKIALSVIVVAISKIRVEGGSSWLHEG